MKQAKVWGLTTEIWSGSSVEIHRIEIAKGGFCSKHRHDHKFNMFHIESGKLQIDIWDKAVNDTINSIIISNGDSFIIEPSDFHRFSALEPTIAYEIYWVELNKNDIHRESFGGVCKTNG